MAKKKKTPTKRLAKDARVIRRRMTEEERVETAKVRAQVEAELGDRIKKPSPARVALAKLQLVRERQGLSLTDVAKRTGMARSNISALLSNADNVEINTLARLAEALECDVIVDIKKRKNRAKS